MKKTLVILFIICSLVSTLCTLATAGATEWEFDRAHSRFYFAIDHTYAKVIGHFEEFSGTFHFDPGNLEESSIYVEVQAKSINTNIRKRDNHLRGDDFFAVKKYPLITFKSKRITHKEGNLYIVEGDFTMKDVTQPLELPLTYFGMKDNPLKQGQIVAGFETIFTINRLDYHVGDGKFHAMGVVGKDVDITVSLEMLRDK